ncbi:putative cytochrome P450 [Paraphaeosphaeria sporulosa]|uniref:Putative cytochrome P450 n=1 Tax=Paraphaeosphaeria sporulosa TaxID=1460663 RepID=A0A177C1S0_9PLEO|nr:putative cytochrome P450 [Paraphaeosphaeria sporulosa]OAG00677.1 putative cytochrome P450 [Paraphaeosphaeria sporulosa]
MMGSIAAFDVVVATLFLIALFLLTASVYRLYLHPLANVPGPKLAALTSLHELWYDCFQGGGGQHAFKMREMHDIYGPIIRINPWEVHIDGQADPAFWYILYSQTNKLDKDGWFYSGFGSGLSMIATTSSDLHRARRGAVSSYFSAAHVRKYEPMVLAHISKLIARLETCSSNGEVVDLANAYRCLTLDVVTSFSVPEPGKMLELDDFGKGFNSLMRDFSKLITLQRHMKVVIPLLELIPDWVGNAMDSSGSFQQLVDWRMSFVKAAQQAIHRKGIPPPGQDASILDTLYSAPELGQKDKVMKYFVEEATNITGAGTETTASTLGLLTYHVLADRDIRNKLLAELSAIGGDNTELIVLRKLERLPYLQACINEALRLSNPVTGRLPRLNPRAPTTYTTPDGKTTYTLPPKTVMSMSMPDLHFNASIFPSPHTFNPSRWIDSSPEHLKEMNRYFVPFSKGSRSCLGIDVAKMELVLTAGNVFQKLGKNMRLWETTERDVSWAYDFFAPYIPVDAKGLRVKIGCGP